MISVNKLFNQHIDSKVCRRGLTSTKYLNWNTEWFAHLRFTSIDLENVFGEYFNLQQSADCGELSKFDFSNCSSETLTYDASTHNKMHTSSLFHSSKRKSCELTQDLALNICSLFSVWLERRLWQWEWQLWWGGSCSSTTGRTGSSTSCRTTSLYPMYQGHLPGPVRPSA